MLTTIIEERVRREALADAELVERREEEKQARERALEEEKLARERALEEERLAKEEERLEKERAFELEKLRLQLETQRSSQPALAPATSSAEPEQPKVDLKRILPKFDPKEDDMALYITLFERQLKFLKVPETTWVPYLIGSLPSEVGRMIVREPEEEYQDYQKVKDLLLKRFKLSADKFRQLFSSHRKNPTSTWRDFMFELNGYLDGWLTELNITTFDQLRNLVLTDQIKRRVPSEVKEHYLDSWPELNTPLELVEKLDAYDNIRLSNRKYLAPPVQKKPYPIKEEISRNALNKKPNNQLPKSEKPKAEKQERPALSCYGCGKPGVIKAKCPVCTPTPKSASANFGNFSLQSMSASEPTACLLVTINGVMGTACPDSGASHTIASEGLYKILKDQGVQFEKSSLRMTLADGSQTDKEVYTTRVTIRLEGRTFKMNLIALPEAKGNHTLLGADFLKKARVVLNLGDQNWYYRDNPRKWFPFVEGYKTPPPAEEQVNTSPAEQVNTGPTGKVNPGPKEKVKVTPKEKVTVTAEEETTPTSPPVATIPYCLSPARREILKKEIDALLATGTIEECDSPYAAPVVLIPKPNGEFRLCIDYRKLNSITKSDPYPLPCMDDLLQKAKQTAYMSTIDLKSGYHQVQMYPPDKDKTAFVCQYGVYRFTRMPFGLKTVPATFQRLMDLFRNGLKVNTLAYLDDIIVLSSTFQEHLDDLRQVFQRLQKFKLHANRAKCHFACQKVKYLGHFITNKGIEVDPAKVEAIARIPPPKSVKHVQSFLQTCSWYRRFIPQFADISRPLSNLTKKRATWKWGEDEQQAFETLKRSLISPPVLSQVDESKPFVIRTDASGYALGAVLTQGQGPEEHPIEYASRLLLPAEKNYSTMEREALAVVWALEKFRGYVEGAEITVITDHQPLKWLLSLKSPTGRLARWALQIQSYNLKVDYLSGKANVIADLLSRPACEHKELSCEICAVVIDLPSRKPSDIREEQLKDPDLKKIIDCFESDATDENYVNWMQRGYLMSQGILYRYAPDSEAEEAQLVVPTQERERVLKEYHDSPTAGHYGAEGTFYKVALRYYFPGMQKFITDYVKNCAECSRFKPSNQKPAGLLRTPAYAQRFETLAIDLFGPLPETADGKKWIFIVEDTSTKWVELFALQEATAKECAVTLLEEVFLRYGLARSIISDNGPQFISAVLQQLCYLFEVSQVFTPVYWPQANPVERKNRDLKPRLAILVGDDHTSWSDKLATIRFAMNTSKCDTTNHTAAYLQFGRELRTVDDVQHDVRTVIDNDNFVAEITPYLRKFARISTEIKDLVEKKQDHHKKYADESRRSAPRYKPGDKVWVSLHPLSNKAKKKTAKFQPRRDGPYIVITQRSPTSYEVANPETPDILLGTYHTSALTPFSETPHSDVVPVAPLRKRGRPPKNRPLKDSPPKTVRGSANSKTQSPPSSSGHSSRRRRGQGGSL